MATAPNPYLTLVNTDTEQSLQGAFQSAADKNPDTEAKLQRLAAQAGVPLEAARLDMPSVERQVALQEVDYKALVDKYPSTAALLADPNNTALAKDDVKNISALEDTMNFGVNTLRSFASGLPNFNEGFYGVLQAGADTVAGLTSPLLGDSPDRNLFAYLAEQASGQRKMSKAVGDVWRGNQEGMGFTQKAALSGFESLGTSVLLAPASVLTGNPGPMLYGMAGQTGGQAYGKARDKGKDVITSLNYGASQAAIEFATEKLPAAFLLRDIGLKSSVVKTAINQVMTEVPGEQVATIFQDLNEWAVLNPQKPFSSYLEERPSAAAQTLIATLVASGGQATIAKATDRLANGAREQQAVDVLTALRDGVMESKTFARAPERVKDFIAKHTANGPMENIFIPADQMQKYFQSANISPERAAVEMGAKNYSEALATGGDVVIPLADFVANVAKTPHYDALLPDIRFTQGEMTQREADLYEKNQPEDMRSMIETYAQSPVATPALSTIQDDITGQLIASGMERGTADTYANLYARTITNLSERGGVDPLALHEQYGLQVVRPMADILTKLGDSDVNLDPLIDRLRAGDVPNAAEINGPGLIEFLRSIGGLNDAGGELRRMEVDKDKAPFVRNLAQITGKALDEATELAREAGYPVDDILDAIQQEVSGQPVYSANNANDELQGLARDLDNLGEYLQSIGVDLKSATNTQIREAMVAAVGNVYNQGDDAKRGYIQFGKDRKFNIALLENSDLSTFLHETGHFWLEVMGDLAASPASTEQLKADYAGILKFLGVESRDQIGVEQHELFARANEAYLREGVAPSVEMRAMFQRFKAWLTMIYKAVSELNVTLSDEVRGVFDRIYASDAEIEAAKDDLDMSMLFVTAQDAGMSAEEFAAYRGSVDAATARAKENLQAKLMRQFAREKQAWWNTERDKVKDQINAELDELPEYKAFDALTKGELPNGTQFKLDKAVLVEQFGKAYVKRLPRGYGEGRGSVFSSTGEGLYPDAAAELIGFTSGAEMVEALINMRPRKALVEAEADQRMLEKHGDMMIDGTIADEAIESLHNDEQANILRLELRALRKKQREVAPFVQVEKDKAAMARRDAIAATETPPVSAFRNAARGLIGQTAVRDINPIGYLHAERKAAKAAFKALAAGDTMEAATQKQRELLNHYLYREATAARETTDKVYTYARKFLKGKARTKFGKAGATYLEQIDSLLDQYEFADVPKTDIVRRENLLNFIAEKMEEGEPVQIPDSILLDAQRRNYKTLPFDQLLAVRDAIANIEHLVNLKTKLLTDKAKRELAEVVADGVASIEENAKGEKRAAIGTRTWMDSAREMRDGYFVAHRKIASLFREMDGFKDDGFMWRTFMNPINEAGNRKAVMTEEATEKLSKLYDLLRKKGLGNKVKGLGLLSKDFYPSLGLSLSKSDILSLALNYGNDGNRQRIRDGYNWTDQQVLAALDRLQPNEWQFVEGMWQLIDSYWSDISAQDKRVNGIAPAKVVASGFVLPSGRRVEGGYYPIKYDERHSVRSYTDRAKEEADRIMRGAVARPGVDTGFTESRAGKIINRKIKLDLGVGLQHIDTVLQTLTHREVLIDLNKILGSSKINGAILDYYGIETYKAISEAIVDVAAGEVGARDAVEKSMAWLRSGATVAAMGWKISTALMQPLGFTQSTVRIGGKWMGRGISRFVGDALHMENATKFVYERSDMMRLRTKTQNREIAEIRNQISKGGLKSDVESTYFYMIVKMQAVVDIPTWLGAYERYMSETNNDESRAIALADQAVIDAQGGGQVKDLAGVQRGGPLKKMWTTFYSYFSSTWNLTVESAKRTDFRKVDDVSRFAVDMLLLYTIPTILGGALKEAIGKGGDDDDESWLAWLAKEQLSYMTGTLIGVRELSGAIQGMFGYSGPAGARFFSEASKLAVQTMQGDADSALLKAANNTAGVLFHYPAGMLQNVVDGFIALKDGKTQNPAALAFGAPKD